jgi:hypothetical protein
VDVKVSDNRRFHRLKAGRHAEAMGNRKIKTGYNLETYQTPSPAWTYITPWMVNMRTGSDELGWRYNAWFKNKGWQAYAGHMGWGGWVRRREWIRLRCLSAPENLLETPMQGALHISADEVMCSDEVMQNVDSVSKALGHVSLDRQKLEMWKSWAQDGGQRSKRRLQDVFRDAEAVSIGFDAWSRADAYLGRHYIQAVHILYFRTGSRRPSH